jgi:NADH-quinone oxidoreductase subunit N
VLYRSGGDEAQGIAGMAQIALVMIVAGLGFRITAVPFHFYAPDVYQGVSNGGAAFLAYIPKIAGFVALIRVLGFVLPPGVESTREPGLALSEQVPIVLWFLAAVTMFLGNLLALLQENLKRMLAYSSVANAGYMLVALASAPYQGVDATGGVAALLYYLIAYGVSTIGVFSAIAFLSSDKRPVESLDDLAGLGRTHSGTALMLAVLMFSMIGIPLTAGFTGKFLIFFGTLSVERMAWLYRVLAFIGVLNAAIAGWYYLRVVTMMYLRTAIKPLEGKGNRSASVSLAVCVFLVLALSVPPGSSWVLGEIRKATGVAAPTVAAPTAQR